MSLAADEVSWGENEVSQMMLKLPRIIVISEENKRPFYG
jgi:hypothetical protein